MNDSPPLNGGTDGAGVVASGGAGGSAADPGCSIACIAPSENDCRAGVAGCPVGNPVAKGCPIGPGAKPWPRAAGERDAPGTPGAADANGAPLPATGAPPLTAGAAGDPTGTCPVTRGPTPWTPPGTPPAQASPGVAAAGGDARAPVPSTVPPGRPPPASALTPLPALPPRAPEPCAAAARSSLLICLGGGTSSVLKPCSRAQVRASPWMPSASRIFFVATMIFPTAAPEAFAASALHRAWMA